MVEALSGGRWQGSSTAEATPTKSNSNFGSWTTTGSQVTESSNVISFDITTRTSTHICSQDLGSALSDDKWILRGKLNYTTLTGGGGSTVYFEVGIGSSATGVIDNDGVEIDFIGLQQRMASGSSDTGWGLVGYDSSGGLNNPESPKIDTDSSTGTDYYFEIKRTADNAMSIGIYNSSSYDTLVTGMPLETKSIATSITGLRYLRISNGQVASESSTGNVIEGTISDLKVWNNTTEATEDEKDSLTNVPANTRYEETDTRKIYRRVTETIDGSDLKAYIKFDDSSGSPTNDAGNVTGNDSLGTAANITLTGTGTTLYDQTGTPSKLGNAMEFPATSSTSGVYGDFGTSTSQFNFLHGGTPTWTIAFWYKTSTAGGTNRAILRTAVGDTVAGITIYFYSNNLRVYIAKTGGGNNQPINSNDDGSDFTSFSSDGNWHFYVITMDFNLASQTLKMSKDDGARTTANKSANACSSISTNSDYALGFRHSPSNGSGYIPPTAQMAELSIWNRVLTDAEITTLYNSGSGFQLDTGDKVWKERNTA